MYRRLITTVLMVMSTMLTLQYLYSEVNEDLATPDISVHRVPRAVPKGHEPEEPAHAHLDTALADKLHKNVRLLCWVMTHPANHFMKAEHVRNTWGRRCNVLLFMSTTSNDQLPTIVLPVEEGREHLWGKTRAAFQYIYDHHRDDAEWFLKADDDTYVIPENVRYLLSRYKSNEALYFGCRFKLHVEQGYMSGGAGYVLSREALERFINQGLTNENMCRTGKDDNSTWEDVEMSKCLQNVGVTAMDTRDEYGRDRFFPASPMNHLFPKPEKHLWYWDYSYYALHQEGETQVSDYAVSFHNMKPEQMYVFDYFLYHARPYGISRA